MKVMMVFDQAQAGLGGKESPDLALGGKSMAIGSSEMFEKIMEGKGGQIAFTIWCGDGTFAADPEINAKKMAAMAKKVEADIVICGPCFNYANYAKMAAKVAFTINELTDIPSFAIMSEECTEAIANFKDKVTILKMPKKGGIGLTQSLTQMCTFAKMLYDKEDTSAFIEEHAYH